MAPDRLGRLVLFGGVTPLGRYLGDTWTYDGVAWTRHEPMVAPSPRAGYALAYDAARRETLLFGGSDGDLLRDTWTWDGSTWTREAPAHAPPIQLGAIMAYDPARRVVVLFGEDGDAYVANTWVWNGRDWRKEHPATSPTSRPGAGLAYDGINHRVVLFGGINPSTCGEEGCEPYGKTWTWDGTTWTKQQPAAAPKRRQGMGMANDPLTGGVVLFGGINDFLVGTIFGDTWTWDGSTWTEHRLDVRPAKRDDMAMAYAPSLGKVVLFGGTEYGLKWYRDTWIWDGTAWSGG
jgi:hypothetical protein